MTTPPSIPFVDSHNHLLFHLPDKEKLRITSLDGHESIRQCTRFDEVHFRMGSVIYHVLEYARHMSDCAALYAPDNPAIDNPGGYYEIWQIKRLYARFLPQSYAVWQNDLKTLPYRKVYQAPLAEGVGIAAIDSWHRYKRMVHEDHVIGLSDLVIIKRQTGDTSYYLNPEGFIPIANPFETGSKDNA